MGNKNSVGCLTVTDGSSILVSISAIFGSEFYFNWEDTPQLPKAWLNKRIKSSYLSMLCWDIFLTTTKMLPILIFTNQCYQVFLWLKTRTTHR